MRELPWILGMVLGMVCAIGILVMVLFVLQSEGNKTAIRTEDVLVAVEAKASEQIFHATDGSCWQLVFGGLGYTGTPYKFTGAMAVNCP